MKERWKTIPEFPRYEISTRGRVRSCGRWGETVYMKLYDSHGYLRARFSVRGVKTFRQVHRLVLEVFVGPRPDGYQCDHINGVRDDNRLENLRWVTPLENILNPVTNARRNRPARSVLCVETGEVFLTEAAAARKIGVTSTMMSYVLNRYKGRYKTAHGLHFRFVEDAQ